MKRFLKNNRKYKNKSLNMNFNIKEFEKNVFVLEIYKIKKFLLSLLNNLTKTLKQLKIINEKLKKKDIRA